MAPASGCSSGAHYHRLARESQSDVLRIPVSFAVQDLCITFDLIKRRTIAGHAQGLKRIYIGRCLPLTVTRIVIL